eukprot:scaffold1_cov375-Pavlova_lutheri.AAC.36
MGAKHPTILEEITLSKGFVATLNGLKGGLVALKGTTATWEEQVRVRLATTVQGSGALRWFLSHQDPQKDGCIKPPRFLHRERGLAEAEALEPQETLQWRFYFSQSCRALRLARFRSTGPA